MGRIKLIIIVIAALLLFDVDYSFAQTVEAENEIKLSSSARKGTLVNYSHDPDTNEIRLVYFTNERRRDLEYEIYVINSATFAQISHEKVRVPKEERKAYEASPAMGETFSVRGIGVKENLPVDGYVDGGGVIGIYSALGQAFGGAMRDLRRGLELQMYRLEYNYDWERNGYVRSVYEGEVINPKGPDDALLDLHHTAVVTDDNGNNLLILVGERAPTGRSAIAAARTGDEVSDPKKNMHIMKFSTNGQRLSEVPLTYEIPQDFLYGNFIEDNSKYAFVLAGWSRDTGSKGELVVVDLDGNIEERINFTIQEQNWKIYDVYKSGDNYYIAGGIADNHGRIEAFQMAVVSKHGEAKVSLTSAEKLEKAAIGDPDNPFGIVRRVMSSRSVAYFPIGRDVTSKGDYLMFGQVGLNHNKDGMGYEDFFLLHFNSNAEFVAQYAFSPKEGAARSDQDFVLDGQKVKWFVYEAVGNAYGYPRIITIDLDNKNVLSDEVVGRGKYFVNIHNGIEYDFTSKKALYLGIDRRARSVWLARVAF